MKPAIVNLTKWEAQTLSKEIKTAVFDANSKIEHAGRLLLDFRDREGWKALGYENWDTCIESEFQSTHGGRRHIFKLIQNAKVIENVEKSSNNGKNGENGNVSASTTTKTGATRGTSIPIKQTEQLAKVEPEKQAEVFDRAKELGGGIATAATVKKAVAEILPNKQVTKKEAKEVQRDTTGFAIPEEIMPLWNRRDKVQGILTAIGKARGALREVMDEMKLNGDDPLFVHANVSGAYGRLNDAWTTVSMALPHAVCPGCQGRAPDTCKLCKGSGFIPKHTYLHAISAELREIREKQCIKKS